MFKFLKLLAVGIAIASTPTGALAADMETAGSNQFGAVHGWKFSADVYGWLPDIKLETSAGDQMELPLWQILQNLNFTFMGGVAAQNGRWSGFSDFIYMNLQGTQTSTAKIIGRPVETGVGVKLQAFTNTSAVGYSFVQNETSDIKVFGGMRYLWLQPDLSFNVGAANGNVVKSGNVIDGIVGVRGQTRFADRFFVSYYADVGTGQSDFTWQALGGLGYKFERLDAIIGYRYLDWNFANKASLDDLTIQGPFAGIKVHF